MVNLSDKELVVQYLTTGSDRYFSQIYSRHRQLVYQKCFVYTGNHDDSEDFVQDIFIRLTRKLTSYKGEAKFTTWLHTVTVNYCIDQLRKQRQNKVLWYNYLQDSTPGNDWTDLSEEISFQLYEQVISQLPESQRDLLLSKYKEGAPIKDIAFSQDLSPSAVKMRIKRAREFARSLYDKLIADVE